MDNVSQYPDQWCASLAVPSFAYNASVVMRLGLRRTKRILCNAYAPCTHGIPTQPLAMPCCV
ncbi:Uncharacterised protein [Schaalia odontolytica]|uniref:Uncharacterized protein n=1 Tax=Schaalia odontolytica TaxID=1660 RepID=A0A2X0U0W5_9ACTO|nr:Uncharacterised protein [Schaalia odontolytica]